MLFEHNQNGVIEVTGHEGLGNVPLKCAVATATKEEDVIVAPSEVSFRHNMVCRGGL